MSLLTMVTVNAQVATKPRWGTPPASDNSGRALNYIYSAPAYAATITVAPNAYTTVIRPAVLTGALTINATVTSCKIGDRLQFLFLSDATGRVVTFGTNLKTSGTLTLTASKYGAIEFVFDGTYFIATGRETE